jgi:hypothetical protein
MAAPMEQGPSSERPPANWTARILAPLALVLSALVVLLVVTGSLGGDDDDGKGRRDREQTATTGCQPTDSGQEAIRQGYYVLQPGDDFASLAEQTCVEIEEIQRLNPNLDPQLLPQGGCVDLKPDGCKVLAEG